MQEINSKTSMPLPPLPSQEFLALLEYQGEVKITEEKDCIVGHVLVCFLDSYRCHQKIFSSIFKAAQKISVRGSTVTAESLMLKLLH